MLCHKKALFLYFNFIFSKIIVFMRYKEGYIDDINFTSLSIFYNNVFLHLTKRTTQNFLNDYYLLKHYYPTRFVFSFNISLSLIKPSNEKHNLFLPNFSLSLTFSYSLFLFFVLLLLFFCSPFILTVLSLTQFILLYYSLTCFFPFYFILCLVFFFLKNIHKSFIGVLFCSFLFL